MPLTYTNSNALSTAHYQLVLSIHNSSQVCTPITPHLPRSHHSSAPHAPHTTSPTHTTPSSHSSLASDGALQLALSHPSVPLSLIPRPCSSSDWSQTPAYRRLQSQQRHDLLLALYARSQLATPVHKDDSERDLLSLEWALPMAVTLTGADNMAAKKTGRSLSSRHPTEYRLCF